MVYTIFSRFNRRISNEKLVEPLKVTEAVYRDELMVKKKPPQSVLLPCNKPVKKSVRFADSEPTIWGEEAEQEEEEDLVMKGRKSCGGGGKNKEFERVGIRVKVKMTKEEAARLLSKCKEGGVLEFKDVARELVSIPLNRLAVVSTSTNNIQ